MGSSPLTRGKPRLDEASLHRGGLIPAHAGKTSGSGCARSRPRAHPRSRGENGFIQVGAPANEGSSPLTRGKPRRAVPHRQPDGLIPAHAGKTVPPAALIVAVAAHPRSRGENNPADTANQASAAHPRSRGENDYYPTGSTLREGSSPLTRGKQQSVGDSPDSVGLIPAHAGKTWDSRGSSNGLRAHPRSRGENEERMNEQ